MAVVAGEERLTYGALDPPLMPALSERLCVFHRGRSATWLLVHGKDESAVWTFHTGDVFFTHFGG